MLSSTSSLPNLRAIYVGIESRLTVRPIPSLDLVDAIADALKDIEMFHGQHAGVGLNGMFGEPGKVEVGFIVRLF